MSLRSVLPWVRGNSKSREVIAGVLCWRRRFGMVAKHWERRRFYRHVSVYKEENEKGWYGVKLDHRHLRTPLRKLFLVPSESLAHAVSEEWLGQGEIIQPSLMHLTALCNTVLDQCDRRPHKERAAILVACISSDTLCFRATEPADLVALQVKEWDPLIKWFNNRFECDVHSSESMVPSSFLVSQSLQSLTEFITSLDRWAFTGFELSVDSCKSLILPCAMFEGQISSDEAGYLATLESNYQMMKWGKVDWHHSVEETDLKARLAAAMVFRNLTGDRNNFI